jgi:hypothetical protein
MRRSKYPSGYYVYAYLRTSNLTPYYVGKGKLDRAWRHHSVVIPKDQDRIVILEENLTEVGSIAIERRLIRWYGRKDNGTGILYNRTDGGEGTSGWTPSEETRKKIGEANRNPSPETRSKMSSSRKARPVASAETRKKLSQAGRGRITSDDTRAKISVRLKGHGFSEETIQKIRQRAVEREARKKSLRPSPG